MIRTLLLFSFAVASIAQAQAPDPKIRQLTEQDHRRMMDLLGIKSLRPGANGNPRATTNPVNYDEAKANPYPDLPDPLTLKNGEKVTTKLMWWNQRRPEIVEDFDREVYGRQPKDTPRVTWEVAETKRETVGQIPAITKKLVGHVDNSADPDIKVDIPVTLTLPANASGPVPVMIEFTWNFFPRPGAATSRFAASRPAGPTSKELLLAHGWGHAALIPTAVQADNGAGLAEGIIGLCNKGQPRKADDWGALRAWAWGASRALDYFETDPAVDAKHCGITGHSRYGKAALVTMAYDPRFAIVFCSSSGEGGAKLHRRNFGELVENLAASGEYHWMAPNFMKYAGPKNWNDLPVDSHELIALCAPRPVFLSVGTADKGDAWVDAKGTFLAGVGAGPVYALLGKKPLASSEFPPIGTLVDGDVAFRQHEAGHVQIPNWPTFLTFADRYIHPPGAR